MSTSIRIKDLKPVDLESPQAFRTWIKTNMEHRYGGKEIPPTHLLIYLDYIESQIRKNNQIDKLFWLGLMRNLKSKFSSLKRVNNEL